MSSEWVSHKLEDIVSLKTGKLDSNAAIERGRYPFFTCSPTTLSIDTFAFDTEAVILAGNNANGVFATKYFNGQFNAYQRTYVVEPLDSRVFCKFLYYAIADRVGHLRELSIGSATKFLTKGILNAIEIPLPPRWEQIEIAESLSALDDRITLLRETNATLEAIAQALFKSWFVDFDPVHAKMEGRAPEGMDEATAALFPDSLDETALGVVPRGWRVTSFSTIANVSSGKRPADRADNPTACTPVPLYGGAGVMGYTSSSLFENPRILTGRVGTLGKVHIAYPPFWASDNVLVVTPLEQRTFSFVYHWLLLIDVMALNRGSTQPLLTQRDLGAQTGVVPSNQVLEAFEGASASLKAKILANTKQAETLSTLRDTLLPRLISGQLRVAEAQTAVEKTFA